MSQRNYTGKPHVRAPVEHAHHHTVITTFGDYDECFRESIDCRAYTK